MSRRSISMIDITNPIGYMQYDPNNNVVQLCAKGMEREAGEKHEEANRFFVQAWNEATTDFEKFTAAHYVARHQKSVGDKLKWDETALAFALKIKDSGIAAQYPSLYLNIAKCYEDLNDLNKAQKYYEAAQSYQSSLPDDGYGQIIRTGIRNGMERVSRL
jgi:tetratricopeptide (TPR) repeat protein